MKCNERYTPATLAPGIPVNAVWPAWCDIAEFPESKAIEVVQWFNDPDLIALCAYQSMRGQVVN